MQYSDVLRFESPVLTFTITLQRRATSNSYYIALLSPDIQITYLKRSKVNNAINSAAMWKCFSMSSWYCSYFASKTEIDEYF